MFKARFSPRSVINQCIRLFSKETLILVWQVAIKIHSFIPRLEYLRIDIHFLLHLGIKIHHNLIQAFLILQKKTADTWAMRITFLFRFRHLRQLEIVMPFLYIQTFDHRLLFVYISKQYTLLLHHRLTILNDIPIDLINITFLQMSEQPLLNNLKRKQFITLPNVPHLRRVVHKGT